MQPVTIVAATATHFTYLGDRFPRNMVVYPGNNDDAKLVDPAGREYPVPLGSTVGGSVPADQEALIDALVPIVSSDNSSVGATASEIGAAVNTLPALTNRSGTVTTGGTAQQIMAANATRISGSFVNLHATSGWLSEIGTAAVDTAGSIECKQGAGILIEGRGAVSYVHPTTGAKFTALEG